VYLPEHTDNSPIDWRQARGVVAFTVLASLAVIIASAVAVLSGVASQPPESHDDGGGVTDVELSTFPYDDPGIPQHPTAPAFGNDG
jgi:hypothetical protein